MEQAAGARIQRAHRYGRVTPALVALLCLVAEPAATQMQPQTFTAEVLLPRMHGRIEELIAQPHVLLEYSYNQINMDFLQTTTTVELRQWLYNQIVSLRATGFKQIEMVYAGLDDGRFLGYFSVSSYTERASTGSATDLEWFPYTLDTVNDAVERGEVFGESGMCDIDSGCDVQALCPDGERVSRCVSQNHENLNVSGEDACQQTGSTWYAPCTEDCCDAHIRNYYSTSLADRGAPINFTGWRVYNHKTRPWYLQAIYQRRYWSDAYEFATTKSLGLTAMKVATDPTGDIVGVLAVDYDAGKLSLLLEDVVGRRKSDNAWGYIVERRNGKLIALSTLETLYSPTLKDTVGFADSRLSAVDVNRTSIATSASILAALGWPSDFYNLSESTLAGYEFHTERVESHGLDWLLVAGQDISCQPAEIWDSLAGACQPCPGDARIVQGECVACPAHSSPDDGLSSCHCDSNYYSLPGDTECFDCPSALVCGGGPIGSTWPLPPPGRWYDYELFASARQAKDEQQVFQCQSAYLCAGSTDGKTCNGDGDGYSCCDKSTDQDSLLCGSCSPGFALTAGRCAPCKETDTTSVLVYLFVCCVLVAVLWVRSATYRCTSTFNTFVFFVQCLALQLDDSVHSVRFFTSLVLLDLDPLSADRCLMDMGFVTKWTVANVWIPLCLAAMLCIMCILDRQCIYPSRSKDGNVLPSILRLKKSLFDLAIILSFPACLWSMKGVICIGIAGRDGEVNVLSDDSTVECYGQQHVPVYTASIVLLTLYCIFVVAILFAIGLRNYRQERRMIFSRGHALDQLQASKGTGESSASQPSSPSELHVLGKLAGKDDANLGPGLQGKPAHSPGRVKHAHEHNETYSEQSGSEEIRACLKRFVRQQPAELRVKEDYEPQDSEQLKLVVGQRVLTRRDPTEGRDEEHMWSGSKKDEPNITGSFPRERVDVLSAESVRWNAEMSSSDALTSSFYPIRVSCFWYPSFQLLGRFIMVVIFTQGHVRRFDGQISASALFDTDTEDSGAVVAAQIDWKTFATVLLIVHLLVLLKCAPFWDQGQNEFATLCTVCLVMTGLGFTGTQHDEVAKCALLIIMIYFAVEVFRTRRRRAGPRTPTARLLRSVRLKLCVGIILVSWYKQKHSRPAVTTTEPSLRQSTTDTQPRISTTVGQSKDESAEPFDLDESHETAKSQRKEIVDLLMKRLHTDDFAENQIEILVTKLKNNEWPALRGLRNVSGGRRPQDCLELLEAMLYLREPLHTVVIDLSQQDPVILEVMRNLCVHETLQGIADSFAREDERIELKVLGVAHTLSHSIPHKNYQFCIRGPILQYADIGVSRMTPLANLGSCLAERGHGDGTIKITQDGQSLLILGQTEDVKEDDLRRWRKHVSEVCSAFKHRATEKHHTINIGPLFERPLELSVYLADCSTRMSQLFPTEADDLEDLAEQFEQHACKMLDQCESGAEVEAALRSAGTALLNGADVYIFALESGLRSIMSAKLVKQYTEDVWTHADVHLLRTGLGADLKRNDEPEDVSLAMRMRDEDKLFQKWVGTRVGPISLFPLIVVLGLCFTATECALIVLASPFAEILCRLDNKSLALSCRRRLAARALDWSYPLIKCYTALMLHLCLLVMVMIAASQYSPTTTYSSEFSWVEVGVYAYALGFLTAELYQLKNLLLERLRVQSVHEVYHLALNDWDDTVQSLMLALHEYTRSSNLLDMVIIVLFAMSFILRCKEQAVYSAGDSTDDRSSRYVFGVNIILLVFRLVDLCSFNRHLGPLWITLKSMVKDIFLFSFMAGALIAAFSGCLQVVFWQQPDIFFYPGDTVEFVLMTFFGEYDTEALYEAEPIGGRLIMISLLVLSTIVQLNMLIAMLTSTYEDLKDHSAAEWRLVRAHIVVEFSDAVRSVMELPLFNIVYFAVGPILRLLFPAIWSYHVKNESPQDSLRQPPVLCTGLPYNYNDRRSLYLENTNDVRGELSVMVHEVRNLPEATGEFDRLNEPYCRIRVGQEIQSTEIVQERTDEQGQRFAAWDEELKINIPQRLRHPLHITVFDSDEYSIDDPLVSNQLELSTKMLKQLQQEQKQWYTLRPASKESGNNRTLSIGDNASGLAAESAPDHANTGDNRIALLSAGSSLEASGADCAQILLTLSYTPRNTQGSRHTQGPQDARASPRACEESEPEYAACIPESDPGGDEEKYSTELKLTVMARDYRHPFVTFFEQPRRVTVRSHDSLSSIIDAMVASQQHAYDFDFTGEGWRRDNVILAHVPPECLSDMRYFVGPFQANVPNETQRYTTLLGLDLDKQPSKRLRDYFSNGRRPAVVDRLLTESVFLLLRSDNDARGWAHLKKNPQQELHQRSQRQADIDGETKLIMKLGKDPIEMDLRVFSQQHKQLLQRFSELEAKMQTRPPEDE